MKPPHCRRAVTGSRTAVLLALSAGAFLLPASAHAATLPVPSVTTAGVSNVTYSSAILYGDVDAHGQLTSYAFQYGPTSAYGSQSPLAPAGNGTVTIKVSQAVTGLQPGVTYHYRVLATSPGGTAKGADRTFATPKIPLSVQIAGVPNPVVFGEPFFVEGTLSGTGASTHEIVLQANPFPYLAGFKDVGNPEVADSAGGFFHVRRARRRGFVRLYGDVAPAEVGALVGFQLLVPGRSINEGGTVVKAGTASVSRFSRVVRLRHPGLYRALIEVDDGAHVSNYSEPILIR